MADAQGHDFWQGIAPQPAAALAAPGDGRLLLHASAPADQAASTLRRSVPGAGPPSPHGGPGGGPGGSAYSPGLVQRRSTRLAGTIIAVGIVFILCLWAAAFLLIRSEQQTALRSARTNVSNLSAAFDEEVTHELDTVSRAMDLVASRMRAAPGDFDIHAWASELPLLAPPAFQAAIIGPDGRLRSTTRDPHPPPSDMSADSCFQALMAPNHPALFIGERTIDRSTGKPVIKVSRRVDAPDGQLLGVVVFSLAPAGLTSLHQKINLGPGGIFALFGTDGVIRVRFTAANPDGTAGIGTKIQSLPARLMSRALHDTIHVGRSPIDHIQRLYGDRLVEGYPLFVGVGLDLDAIMAPVNAQARRIEAVAAIVSLLLCGLLGALAREVWRRARHEAQLARERSALAADIALRQQVEQQLRESEQKFQDIAEVSGDWIWETDADHRLTYLTTDMLTGMVGGSPFSNLGKRRWEVAGGDPERDEKWRQHKADLDAHRPFRMFRYMTAADAGPFRHIVVSGKPVFDAAGKFLGYRGTASNETPMVEARQRAEQAETLLRDAMDSLSEGFVIYDRDDRLVLCNEAYRRMYPDSAHLMVPGVKFETLVRNSLASGNYPDAVGREEEWVADFMRIHNSAVTELETHMRDGRWLLVSERRMRNGGLAGVRVDITEFKRIQNALRESERRLRDFAELASDWFWEQDADLRFTWFSDGLHTTIAASPQPYMGKQRWEMHPDGTTPEQWEAHKADLAARRPFRDFRYYLPNSAGGIRYTSVHGLPMFDEAGQFIGYRGIGRDVTAQIKAEQELEQAKERAEQAQTLLRDAVDSMSEGFVIFDQEDRLVMWNDAYREIYSDGADILQPGIPFEAFLRHVVAKGSNLNARGREAEWIAERLRFHREAAGAQESLRGNGHWYLATDRRMKNGGIAGLRIDITALKQAQAALRESEERLDRAQAIAGIGSWELDLATRRYAWSKELFRIRGLDPEHFVPTIDSVANYIHPDDYPAARRWIDELMAGRAQPALEPRMVRPDGEVRVLRVEGRAVRDAAGVVRHVAGTMQDITERRLIERQLAQAQKMEAIGSLTGGMAHDFNNVLGVIIGNLELLRRFIDDDAAAADLCTEALDGATRCAELIRRLLAFARRQSLYPEETDVNELVGDIARMLGRILGEDIKLSLHLDAAVRPVLADQAQLEAALVNFATNARDAMPDGGRLEIATHNVVLDASYVALHPDVIPGAYVEIEISDSGAGIAPDIVSRIFEPFFTTKEPGKGTGLGLSMAFGFAKQSGGHLSVYSEPGLGTTFRLYLPSVADDHAVSAPPSGTAAMARGHETVLVAEDNMPLRRAAVRQLTGLGYQVIEAEHADAALAILASTARVDLLFTDLVMPGNLGGLDLAHRATALRPGLKVLLTSGFPGRHTANDRVADSPFPILNKPYRHSDLARVIREVLDGRTGQSAAGARRTVRADAGRLASQTTHEGGST